MHIFCAVLSSSTQMTRFNEDQTPFAAEGLVLAHVRAAQPAARRVITVLVGEHAFNHQDLFTAPMTVRVEKGLWRPAHQGGVLGLEGVERQNPQALYQTLASLALPCVDDHALIVTRV